MIDTILSILAQRMDHTVPENRELQPDSPGLVGMEAISSSDSGLPEDHLSDWRLITTERSGSQRFYIGDRLEQKRTVSTTVHQLTVYVDHGPRTPLPGGGEAPAHRGEATVTIHPGSTPDVISSSIQRAIFAASRSKAPRFNIPGPSEATLSVPASGFATGDRETWMDCLAEALFAPARKRTDARINTLELFLTKVRTGFMNSRGLRWEAERHEGECEFIVDAAPGTGPVELYNDILFGEPDLERLGAETGTYLDLVADRAKAFPTPALSGVPVILRGESAEAVFAWFFDSARTDLVYSKASPFPTGSAIQGAAPVTEALDITAEAVIPGLSRSGARDSEGFPLTPRPVIESGTVTTLHGPVRYAERLGVPATGAFSLFSVSPGKRSLTELKATPHLEIFSFSDFQMDQASGSFGSEIRFARYFDGDHSIPVTGGSISGSLFENRSIMLRCAELGLGTRSLAPVAVLLPVVTVTPAPGADTGM